MTRTTSETPAAPSPAVLGRFALEGTLLSVEPLARGHIHDTFVSRWSTPSGPRRFLHQRINDRVFTDVPALMHNVATITEHLRRSQRDADGMRTLELVSTRDGAAFLTDPSGIWRTYRFIEDTQSFDRCDDPSLAYEAARAFGRFQSRLSDLDPASLRVTIPGFFDAPERLRQLDAARRRDAHARAARVADELAFVDARRTDAGAMEHALGSGLIPHRTVHGDTKLNNVLFDRQSRRAVAVVDLDTCMAGWSLYDFGDLVRFTAATSAEDEPDVARAGIDLALYEALARGYLESARAFLTPWELERLPFAARLVTLTIGVRFLADHLAGDVYFKTSRPDHNLDRARVQLRMVEEMERQERELAELSR